MDTNLDFVRWLSKKLYEINVGFYLTVGLIMALPYVLGMIGLPAFLARFCAFFVVCFLRAGYESVVVYETPIKRLSLYKMLLLTFVTAGLLSLVAHFLRPKIGYFSIPLSFLVSMLVVGKLKNILWPATERTGFVALLPAKLKLVSWSRYGFYGFLVGLTYLACGYFGVIFIIAFGISFFIGMIFEEVYNTIKLYEEQITLKSLFTIIVWSAVCAAGCAATVFVLMSRYGFSSQISIITSVIVFKLIQPLGSRIFILRVYKVS